MSPIDTAPIDAAAARSELIARALAKASAEHAGQVRTGSGGLPYIEHPRMVAATLAERGYRDEVLAAALLHDVVEDSDTTVEDLRGEFGEEIAALVDTLSDDESIAGYRDRKDEHRARVGAADGDALPIYAADKLANMTTLHAAIEAEGIKVADEYDTPLAVKLEVWEADASMLSCEAPRLSLLEPLTAAISRLAEDLRAADPHPCT
jgi:guanosine-3',5'-bis(diphosphate) 3'-pyrophosphohydrolase